MRSSAIVLPTGPARVNRARILFSHLTRRPDADIDLGAAALVIAEAENPGLDIETYIARLDGIATDVNRIPGPRRTVLLQHMFGDLGFRGNETDYYDPKNSYLHDVLDRRLGIPITLAVVLMEVGRRVGVDVHGIAFPGHFLIGIDGDFLDPYHGGAKLTRDTLTARLRRALGATAELDGKHLAPATKRQILSRMLHNLRGIHQRRGDARREAGVAELLDALGEKPRAEVAH